MTAKQKLDVQLKRAYEPPAKADGTRVLVDRLWPRGVTKEALAIERWIKEPDCIPADEFISKTRSCFICIASKMMTYYR